jgi:hypothetical protein
MTRISKSRVGLLRVNHSAQIHMFGHKTYKEHASAEEHVQ